MEEREGGAGRVDQAWRRDRCWGRVCSGSGRVVTEDIKGFELLNLRGSGHGLQKPVVKKTDVHQNSGLAKAQGFVVAAFNVWVSELTPNQVVGEEEDFTGVMKVMVVSGGVGEEIAWW
ncbi:hypothetical protein FF1_027627 [Malus domestica]